MTLLPNALRTRGATIAASLASALLASIGPVTAGAAEARSLACEFAAGQSASFDGGSFKTKPPAPLNFLIVDIDLEAQTARIATGPAGTMGSLKIVRAINANHFIEVLNEGFLTLTTVYEVEGADGTLAAVHSRHAGVLGQPIVTHYTGSCRKR